jgi:hypothetical protein
MTRVLSIVFVGMVGFVVSVGIALFVLRQSAPDMPAPAEEGSSVEAEPSVSTLHRAFCDASRSGVNLVRVVDGANAWLVLCSPGKPERVLMSVENEQTASHFDTHLAPEELASRVSVEAEGDLDGDSVPEFVLAFSVGNKDCAFPGHYRVVKVSDGDRVVLSEPFGACLANPILRTGEKGKEFFVTSVPGKAGSEGKTARLENGTVVFADGRALEDAVALPGEKMKFVASLEAREFLKSGKKPLVFKGDLNDDKEDETLQCSDLGSRGMRCAISRGTEMLQTFEPRLSIRVVGSKTGGWNDLVLDDTTTYVWQSGRYEIRK